MYYYTKAIYLSFEETVQKLTNALNAAGFWVLTGFDVKDSLSNKFNVDLRPYIILCVCNPPFSNKDLSIENENEIILPFNIVIQQNGNFVEVAVLEPVVPVQAAHNSACEDIALIIKSKLRSVVDSL